MINFSKMYLQTAIQYHKLGREFIRTGKEYMDVQFPDYSASCLVAAGRLLEKRDACLKHAREARPKKEIAHVA